MSTPIIFISRSKIKEGKFHALEVTYKGLAQRLEAKGNHVAFLAYTNEEGTELTSVHVFADEKMMESHMNGAAEFVQATAGFIDTTAIEIYGQPTSHVMDILKQIVASGVPFTIEPKSIGGFVRPAAG